MGTVMSWDEVENGYCDALNSGGAFRVGGSEYDASVVLKSVDRVAYEQGLADYAAGLSETYLIDGINYEEVA